jgi:hypothetical protein
MLTNPNIQAFNCLPSTRSQVRYRQGQDKL